MGGGLGVLNFSRKILVPKKAYFNRNDSKILNKFIFFCQQYQPFSAEWVGLDQPLLEGNLDQNNSPAGNSF